MEKNKLELQQTKKELDRLIKNRAAVYEVVSDMIFLIRDDHVIEDMNQSAVRAFGDQRGKLCHQVIFKCAEACEKAICPVHLNSSGQRFDCPIERQSEDIFFEYNFVPFQGYQGDTLTMVVIRDITKRKKHELELAEFHNNIEKVLKQKITDLKDSEKVRKKLANEVNLLKKELDRLTTQDEMIGDSKRIRELREMVYQVADSDATILITGESGTGKELIADMVLTHSNRQKKPYLKFNCAAVSESLLESDLFGYEKGSFTGALTTRKGKFEIADGGTIFLDEIGDISPRMQAALLRVLQNGEIIRVGGTSPIKVDVRIIAATNVDLAEAVETGKFRKDLYYRLNVINFLQPPLRERKEDIVPLATFFVKKYRTAFKKDINFLPEKVINKLLLHDWPGNVRELENVIQRAVLLAKNNVITENELDFKVKNQTLDINGGSQVLAIDDQLLNQPLKDLVAEFEKMIIANILEKTNGKVQEVSDKLQIGKTALYEKIKRYGILPQQFKK